MVATSLQTGRNGSRNSCAIFDVKFWVLWVVWTRPEKNDGDQKRGRANDLKNNTEGSFTMLAWL